MLSALALQAHLVDKGAVTIVRTPNTEIEHVHAGLDSVIEGIEEPRCEGHLSLSEYAECVNFRMLCKATAWSMFGSDYSGHKGAMPKTIQQCVFVSPL